MNEYLKTTKKILLLSLIPIIILTINLFKKSFYHKTDSLTIGILQTISHASLDEARRGFIDYLNNNLNKKISFIIQNADGSIPQAQSIAESFHRNSKIDAIFTIATPALAVMHNIEKTKPIIFAAVSNPANLGIIYEGSNVSGSSDKINSKFFTNQIHKLLPNARKVGILFNSGETNSALIAEELSNEFSKLNITPKKIGFNNAVEIPLALKIGIRDIDVIVSPTDNTVASAISTISEIAISEQKPFIASFEAAAKEGALAAMGVDYYNSGKIAAQMAIDVLINKKSPDSLAIAVPPMQKMVINKNTLDSLKISLPKEILSQVEFVN